MNSIASSRFETIFQETHTWNFRIQIFLKTFAILNAKQFIMM